MVDVDFLREFRLQRDLIEVRAMNQFARLLADRFDQARVAMAERTHRDAGAEIVVMFPIRIPKVATLATLRHKRETPVGGKDMLLKLFGGGHRRGGP